MKLTAVLGFIGGVLLLFIGIGCCFRAFINDYNAGSYMFFGLLCMVCGGCVVEVCEKALKELK